MKHSVLGVCLHDISHDIVFPEPDTDLSIVTRDHMVHVAKTRGSHEGWKANYTLLAWHRDNNSRR